MGTVATGFRLMSQSPGFGVAGRESGATFMVPLQAKAPDPTPMGPSVTESGPSWSMKASGTANSGEDVALTWDASGHLTTDLAPSESIGATTRSMVSINAILYVLCCACVAFTLTPFTCSQQ